MRHLSFPYPATHTQSGLGLTSLPHNEPSLVQHRTARTSRVSPFLAASNTPAILFRRAKFRSHARTQSWSLRADSPCFFFY